MGSGYEGIEKPVHLKLHVMQRFCDKVTTYKDAGHLAFCCWLMFSQLLKNLAETKGFEQATLPTATFPNLGTMVIWHQALFCTTGISMVKGIFPKQFIYCWGSQFFLKKCLALSRWWCPAVRMSPIHLFPSLVTKASLLAGVGFALAMNLGADWTHLPWFVTSNLCWAPLRHD